MRVSCKLVALASLVTLGLAGSTSCDDTLPPRGQVLLYLDTDAPVRPSASLLEPAALFDRVLVELYAPGASEPCLDCRRELVVDVAKLEARRFSFGFVAPPRVVGYRAKLVLFRSVAGLGARPGSSIELVGYMPAVAEEGITEMTARFLTDDVGRPRGTLAAPIVFERGAPAAAVAGGHGGDGRTWPGARVLDCAGEAPPGSVCVPGGAFFMGDPRVTIDASLGGALEHIAILPPFFLDAEEVTVAAVRASGLAKLDSRGRSKDPTDDLGDILGGCDYTSAPGGNETLAVNCVTWSLAASFCRARGGDLPSEAELEMVASARGTRLAPWGDGEPTCEDAAVARELRRDAGGCSDAPDVGVGGRALPAAPGSGARDRAVLPGGVIVDLGANVREWTRDAFQRDDGSCWAAPVLAPPACAVPTPSSYTIKGADFLSLPVRFVQTRSGLDPTFQRRDVGFRCAYTATPAVR